MVLIQPIFSVLSMGRKGEREEGGGDDDPEQVIYIDSFNW